MTSAFWVEGRTGWDRVHALVHENDFVFEGVWGDIAPVSFACAAWRAVTTPLAEPGYVRWHRRILSASCERNYYDGSLVARLKIVSPPPAELTVSRTWWRDRGWHGWPEVFGQFVVPAEEDLTKIPYVRPVLLVDAPLPLDDLPPAPEGPGDEAAEAARRAIVVLVRELNALVGPILDQLDG